FPSGEIQAEINRIALHLEAVEVPARPPITSSTTSMHSDA
ncbi:MAG: hypothetical protein ACI9UA_003129, partial [Pseudoalteromonas tetraodonis]